MDPNKLQEIIESIQGTCRSLSEILGWFDLTEEDLSDEDIDEIDSSVFCCDNCGWWYDKGEETYSSIAGCYMCDSCAEDLENEAREKQEEEDEESEE